MRTTLLGGTRRIFLIAVPLLIVSALILSACGGSKATSTAASTTTGNTSSGAAPTAMAGMASMTSGGAMTTAQGAFDQQFIDMMVPHHMGAVAMAQIAQTRAEHPELKTLATNIIAAQNTEIGQMRQWRMAWFGSDQTPSMDQMPALPGMNMTAMNSMNMMQDITNLQTATPFDKAFLQAMIPHHQSAIDAATVAANMGQHPEIKTLAASIIAGQQKENIQMQGWLKAWYGQ